MKNNRIRNAYDSINPSPADKQRMLDAILAEAKLEASPRQSRKSREPVIYTAKQSTTHKRNNIFGTLAAAVVLLLVAGFGISWLMNREPVNPVADEPTAEVTIPMATAGDHYAPVLEKYRRAIAEGWTKEQCKIEGISTRMQAGNDISRAGFTLLDLDGDSREELLIAEDPPTGQTISGISIPRWKTEPPFSFGWMNRTAASAGSLKITLSAFPIPISMNWN